MQTADHSDSSNRADRADCAIFLFAFFFNCDLQMIKVYTPFSYSFGNVGTD